MSNTFASLRKKSNGIEDIRNKFKKLQNNGGGNRNVTLEDETFWDISHVRGSDGTGHAVVRFLPAGPTEDDPILKIEEYNWKGPGGYYINLSRRTLDPSFPDPAYEYNGTVFGDKSLTKDEKMAKLVNRKESFVVNIEVISDPNKPENNGKIFRWKFGPMINKIVEGALFPEFETDAPINVFDPFEGANFELRVITKKIPDRSSGKMVDVPSYEKSRFQKVSEYKSEDEFEEVWQTLLPLKSIILEDKFKSYDVLKAELDRALGKGKENSDENEDLPENKPKVTPKVKTVKVETTKAPETIDDEIPFEHPSVVEKETKVEEVETGGTDDIDDWLNSITK